MIDSASDPTLGGTDMLLTRIITALALFPVVAGAVIAGDVWFLAVVGVVALIAGWEFSRMMAEGGYKTTTAITLALIALLLLDAHRSDLNLNCILSFVLVLSIIWQLFRADSTSPTADWALTLAGGLYIGWGGAHLLALRQLVEGMAWVWLVLLATWGADIFAFVVGKTWGRHKIWPRHSPKKTWEGLLGGFIGAFVGAAIVIFGLGLNWLDTLIVAAIIPGVALLGDLSVSMMKRNVGVKDASNLFPGHGGFLDRLDSFLLVTVVVYHYVVWVAFLTP